MNRQYTIWNELRRLQEEMDQIFSRFTFEEPSQTRARYLSGPEMPMLPNYRQAMTDMWETNNQIIAILELPGVAKEDISINTKDNGVEIKVERHEERKEEAKGLYKIGRTYAGFYRYLSLPESADLENIDASYRNGILELKIPKKEKPESSAKKITIK